MGKRRSKVKRGGGLQEPGTQLPSQSQSKSKSKIFRSKKRQKLRGKR